MSKTHSSAPGPQPLHYDFFTTVAVAIWDAALAQKASKKGALFVVSHASLESGFAQSAIKHDDYNLFGQMTRGNDFKRKTSAGNVKDFSKVGGYTASMVYYFGHINAHKWSGLDLIQKEDFTAQDIDDAFNTGTDYPTAKERHDGKYAYNDDKDPDGKNHYGEKLYRQMKTTKTRMAAALEYKIEVNQDAIRLLEKSLEPKPVTAPGAAGVVPYRTQTSIIVQNPLASNSPSGAPENDQKKATLVRENTKLQSVLVAIRAVPL